MPSDMVEQTHIYLYSTTFWVASEVHSFLGGLDFGAHNRKSGKLECPRYNKTITKNQEP